MTSGGPGRIVIVCPTLLDHDAVGGAAAALYRDLTACPDWSVTMVSRRNDRTDTPAEIVGSLGELLFSPTFLGADLIIYVFAIYNELFDAMLIGNGRARQAVRFHNVTPRAFVEPRDIDLIDRSVDQLRNFDAVDEIWADSQENADELDRRKIAGGKIRVLPLSVDPEVRGRQANKPGGRLNLLYVGRFVPSKGLDDLVAALAIVARRSSLPFHARLVGNLKSAPAKHLEELQASVVGRRLSRRVEMEGPVSLSELGRAYAQAHLVVTASRHEGFCVPVIEGLAAGCIPVTYSNSNLRNISAGLGRLAIRDTPEALASAIIQVGEAVLDDGKTFLPLDRGETSVGDFDLMAAGYVKQFRSGTCARRVQARVRSLLASKASASRAGPDSESSETVLASVTKGGY